MKVTDFERVATILATTDLVTIECPKCCGICDERSLERSVGPRRECDCRRCGRGWIEVANWVQPVEDAHKDAEAVDQHG